MKLKFLAVLTFTLGIFLTGGATAGASQRIDLAINNAWFFQSYSDGNQTSTTGFPSFDPSGDAIKISATLDADGNFTLPPDQFRFEPIVPVGQPSYASLAFEASGPVTGTYSSDTGSMSMSLPLRYKLTTSDPSSPQSPPINCEFAGFTAELETSGTLPYSTLTFAGKPFADRDGQLLGSWSIPYSTIAEEIKGFDGTPDATCQNMLAGAVGDFGGTVWLRANVDVVELIPVRLAFKPKAKKLKAGKSTSLKLRVQNATDSRQTIKVALKSSNRNVSVKKSISVSVPARAVLLTSVKVKAGKKAKGKATITASASGQRTTAALTLKKAKN